MTVCRHILHSELVEYFSNPKEILVIEGVRQTGKTTAIKQALAGKEAVFITLTDETIPVIRLREAQTFEDFSEILKRDFGFDPQKKWPLIIDEAQKSIFIHRFVLKMHADWKGVPIVLSGSAMGVFFKRSDMQKTVSPAGRVKRLVCRPFSFAEYLDLVGDQSILHILKSWERGKNISDVEHKRLMSHFYEYMTVGGFPESIQSRFSIEKNHDYLETLLSFFWQDADRYLSELTGSNKRQYGALFRVLLESVARLTSFSSTRSSLVSTDSPAYRVDVPMLLDAAEEWHFIFRLETKMAALTTKQGHNSKKYLWDVGVVNHLLNAGRPVGPSTSPDLLAKLLESFVAQELVFYLQQKTRLFCWKSQARQQREMDFMARFPHQDVGIEVKASSSINRKALSQLQEFRIKNPKSPCFVVYLGMPKQTDGIWFIPPYLVGWLPLSFKGTHVTHG